MMKPSRSEPLQNPKELYKERTSAASRGEGYATLFAFAPHHQRLAEPLILVDARGS